MHKNLTECDACGYRLVPPVPERCPECGNDLRSARLEFIRRDLGLACKCFALSAAIPLIAVFLFSRLSFTSEMAALVLIGGGLGLSALLSVGAALVGLTLLVGAWLLTNSTERQSPGRLRRAFLLATFFAGLPWLAMYCAWGLVF